MVVEPKIVPESRMQRMSVDEVAQGHVLVLYTALQSLDEHVDEHGDDVSSEPWIFDPYSTACEGTCWIHFQRPPSITIL